MSENNTSRLETLDQIKAIALVWIFLNHTAESMWGHPFIANPSADWPSLAERWAQLMPLQGTGFSVVAANVLRYVGWFGDQAVSWFILLSGFALSTAQWKRVDTGQVDSLPAFYLRRFRRVLPTWWTVHLLLLLPIALIGWKISIADPRFFLSFAGIRLAPDQLYFGIPAWWFISLILQLYLVFPFLHRLLVRIGAIPGTVLLVTITLLVRWWGMHFHADWIDPWNRGSIFISRVAEFSTGMGLAFLVHSDKSKMIAWGETRGALVAAMAIFALGNIASMSFHGAVIAQWFLAISGTMLAYGFLTSSAWEFFSPLFGPVLRWTGRHSLSLFLVHHPVVWMLLPRRSDPHLTGQVLARMGVAIIGSILLALVVERVAGRLTLAIENGNRRWGIRGLLARIGLALAATVLAVLPVELLIQRRAPQDITDFGWSERPALIADDDLGFRLRPNSKTRLRWESYDYVVIANSEGFPGPNLPTDKRDDTFRIMALGDAFTSAEGVNTNEAWPRQLESKLQELAEQNEIGKHIDVTNFGITGFGPNQYAILVETYAPSLHPDLIVIGFFTNDYVDVQCSADDFRAMVGFDRPSPNTWSTLLTGRHLFRYLRGHVAEAAFERLTKEPCSHTRFFCQSDLFERRNTDYVLSGRDLVQSRFEVIRDVAKETGARVLIMSIPAPIQVVPIEQLQYIRPDVEASLQDTSRYDYEQPQRLTAALAKNCGFEHLDLRPALQAATDRQPYQAHNLHFTKEGHVIVSDALIPLVKAHIQMTAAPSAKPDQTE